MPASAKTYHPPVQIAPETFVIQDAQGEGTAPAVIHLNSMLIRGAEPIVVDTGAPTNRTQFLTDLFGLVDPDEVRWVFLSHDDIDHHGNLEAVMAECPNATLVTSWFAMDRLACGGFNVPPTRWRWVNDGESFDAGDRTLVALCPPLFDSPTTRGLLDARTGVYWAADCFACPVPVPTRDAADLPEEFWRAGFALFQQWNSPWVNMLDESRYQQRVDQLASQDISAIASTHGPAIGADRLALAFDLLRAVPSCEVPPQPGQPALDAMLAALGVTAA